MEEGGVVSYFGIRGLIKNLVPPYHINLVHPSYKDTIRTPLNWICVHL